MKKETTKSKKNLTSEMEPPPPLPPQEETYRFIKLLSGEDILCTIEGITSELVVVRHPLKVTTIYDPNLDEALYMFVPWVPFTEQTCIGINSSTIVTLTSVKDPVKEVYLRKVASFTNHKMIQAKVPRKPVENEPTDVDMNPPIDLSEEEETQAEQQAKTEAKKKKDKIRVN